MQIWRRHQPIHEPNVARRARCRSPLQRTLLHNGLDKTLICEIGHVSLERLGLYGLEQDQHNCTLISRRVRAVEERLKELRRAKMAINKTEPNGLRHSQ